MLTGREQAFGMIELIVAAAISLVVIGTFLMVFQSTLLHSSRTDARSISSARLSDALDRLGDDVRAARKAERADVVRMSTRDEIRIQLQRDPIRYGDIPLATPTRLAMWTESESDPAGPRCVTWQFQQVTDGRPVAALVRYSGPAGGACPNTNVTPEVVMTLGTTTLPTDAFAYGTLTPSGGGACSVQSQRSVGTAAGRLMIVSVDLDLTSSAARVQSGAQSNVGRDAIDVWSRLNDDYYYAVGCAQ